MASGYSDLSEIRKDGRSFGAYPKPPKINLLNEQPRRESIIEQQLTSAIIRPNFGQQQQQQQQQQLAGGYLYQPNQQAASRYLDQQPHQQVIFNYQQQQQQRQQHQSSFNPIRSQEFNNDGDQSSHHQFMSIAPVTSYSTITRSNESGVRGQAPPMAGSSSSNFGYSSYDGSNQFSPIGPNKTQVRATCVTNFNMTRGGLPASQDLEAITNDMEAKIKREIAYRNLHQNQWSRPRQTREPRREPVPRNARSDQRWVKECTGSNPSSRPTSRASSTRSTTEADLLDRTAKLLQEAEEFEKKPLIKQQLLIESGARRAQPMQSSLSSASDASQNVGSIHTAIIKVPNHEVDNKSPLPFAFDNFSTLGVRGNIASVGAAPPEKPYPPIFPQIKRTPSPAPRRG